MKQDLSKIGIQMDFQPIDFGVLGDKLAIPISGKLILARQLAEVLTPNGSANFGLLTVNSSVQSETNSRTTTYRGREVADWEAEIGRLYIEGGVGRS